MEAKHALMEVEMPNTRVIQVIKNTDICRIRKKCISKYTPFDLGLCEGWKENNVKWHKQQLHKVVCKDIDCMSRTSGMSIA